MATATDTDRKTRRIEKFKQRNQQAERDAAELANALKVMLVAVPDLPRINDARTVAKQALRAHFERLPLKDIR